MLTFRIVPALKEELRAEAVKEDCSTATMIAVMIRDYCGRNGVALTEQDVLLGEVGKSRTRSTKK